MEHLLLLADQFLMLLQQSQVVDEDPTNALGKSLNWCPFSSLQPPSTLQ